MKKILFLTFMFLSIPLWSAEELSFGVVPTASRREAEVISKVVSVSDKKEALGLLKEASENKWAGAAIWFNLANVQMSEGDIVGAVESYKRTLKFSPSFFAARKNLAFALERSGDINAAQIEMKAALALSGGSDVAILMRLADLRSKERDFSSALTLCNQALVYDSNNENLRFAKACFLFELENFLECENLCLEILSKRSKHFDAIRLLGKSRAKRGDITSAISAFEVLKKSGNATKGDIAFLGDLFFQKKLYELALENYILAGNEKSAENAALAVLYSGDAEGALKMSKIFASPLKEKIEGLANYELGRFEKAFELLATYQKKNSDDFLCAIKTAETAYSLGKLTDAEFYFSCASVDNKYASQALYGLLRVAIARENFKEALKFAKRLQKENSNSEISDYIKYLEKYVAEME